MGAIDIKTFENPFKTCPTCDDRKIQQVVERQVKADFLLFKEEYHNKGKDQIINYMENEEKLK